MPQTDILLATLNARYPHCAFGLRYLHANLGELAPSARIVEFTISQQTRDIAEQILALQPRILGLGVYIWNTRQTLDLVSTLKRVRPELVIVLGGPEVSHETAGQPLAALADHIIQGEADFAFRDLCAFYVGGLDVEATAPKPARVIAAPLPEIRDIASPYALYSDEDIRHRVLYVEASRGCPYKCEYCLSSLDKSVRSFDLDRFLADMDSLITRGARQFKFVDRTFNLSIPTSTRILEFFLERMHHGLFIHFEMVPDRLPPELRELIKRFPPGALQFEIGVQTWDAEVSKRISRRQDLTKLQENFKFLVAETGVHIHADLIAGLPGETLETFAHGFDQLARLAPHEIQVGILKRLKGTPIVRHDREWEMVYDEAPPFQILRTRAMDFTTLQHVARFAKFWDMVGNSGSFAQAMGLVRGLAHARGSLFWQFWELSGFLSARHGQTHSIALVNLTESLWVYLSERCGADIARAALIADYAHGATRRDIPQFLAAARTPGGKDAAPRASARERGHEPSLATPLPDRQRRHRTPALTQAAP